MRKILFLFLSFGAMACGDFGESHASGTFRLTDSGIRCATAPCAAILVTRLDAPGSSVTVGEIDFPSSMSMEERHDLMNQVMSPGSSVVARGTVHGEGDHGVFELEAVIE
jgi:hypothetical protein